MPHVLRLNRIAMACRCEVVVVHASRHHALRSAEAALDEISRVEQLLSRFDPTSEIARINREASHGPVRLDFEVFQLISACLEACHQTGGAFDPAVSAVGSQPNRILLDKARRTVQLADPQVQLDLGGCGKGYALDCAGQRLKSLGVTDACLHAGTSSVLALGSPPDAPGWPVGICDPRDREREAHRLSLSHQGLSTSVVSASNPDVIDPRQGEALTGIRSCTVVSQTAWLSEIWSTAVLVSGRETASQLPAFHKAVEQIFWLEPANHL